MTTSKGTMATLILFLTLGILPASSRAEATEPTKPASSAGLLFHLKTAASSDDSQICVAYNMIWSAAASGRKVSVLVDAGGVMTYSRNWMGRDKFGAYKLPSNLRQLLSDKMKVPLEKVPVTYGEYVRMLHKIGVEFYVNGGMLVVAGIEKEFGQTGHLTVDFFKPVGFAEMTQLFDSAGTYIVY